MGDALGLGALVLLRDKSFRSFAIMLLLAMIPFQWYNVYCAAYLKESGYQYLTTTMNIGQAGEIFFMLLVPLIFRRIGYRRSIVLALAVLALRNIFFAVSSAYGFAALDFCGIVVHGLIFGLLVVGAQMFVDEVAPPELRNQAQGLVNLILAGVGVFAYAVDDCLFRRHSYLARNSCLRICDSEIRQVSRHQDFLWSFLGGWP